MLPEPTGDAARAGLAALIAEPESALVGLDYDGTLSPIVERAEDARPAEGALEALERVAARVRLLAIVTGRPVRDVVGFLGLEDSPALGSVVVVGHYGLEHWAGGIVTAPTPEPGADLARERLPALLAGFPPEVYVEDKSHALVVHTRRAPEPARVLAALRPALTALAADVGLEAAAGRYVCELRPRFSDKGAALRRLVAEHGARSVLFAGDDLGDLPAFAAVESLRAQGLPGLTVCSGSEEVPEVRARADLVVDGPAGVVRLLTGLLDAFPPR